MSLQLNPVQVQSNIYDWLEANTTRSSLEFVDDQSTNEQLYFRAVITKVYSDDDDEDGSGLVNNRLPKQAWDDAEQTLGPAYRIEESSGGVLDIYVSHPNTTQAQQLRHRFTRRAGIALKSVWSPTVCYTTLLLSLFTFFVASYFLHELWHEFEKPWESPFSYVQSVFWHFVKVFGAVFVFLGGGSVVALLLWILKVTTK